MPPIIKEIEEKLSAGGEFIDYEFDLRPEVGPDTLKAFFRSALRRVVEETIEELRTSIEGAEPWDYDCFAAKAEEIIQSLENKQ